MMEKKKGFALVLLIFLLVAASLVALVAFSLLAQGTTSGLGLAESMQAFAIALGGKEWYLQQLADDTNWTDEANQAHNLGAGSFDITVNNTSGNKISFTITGKVPGYFNQTVQRQISLSAIKLPKACNFAVFWQQDGPGERLTLNRLASGTVISGNFWSRGSTRINKPCEVSAGEVYYGAGEIIDGSGTYVTEVVNPPFPEMPLVNTASYAELMEQYDADIDSNTSTNSTPQSGIITLSGNTLEFYDFQSEEDLIITGYGKIVAKNDVLLHTSVGKGKKEGSGTNNLTIIPQGGTIEILAGNNFFINRSEVEWGWGRLIVEIKPGTIMYARNQGADKVFQINSRNTAIEQALILARRKLTVDQANIIKSTLYVDYAGEAANNLLAISGTKAQVSGAVISRGRSSPSLQITDSASITGLVYQYGYPLEAPTAGEGQAQVDGGVTITGALLARQFYQDSLGPATITHDLQAILSVLPEGFSGGVMTEENSWDDH